MIRLIFVASWTTTALAFSLYSRSWIRDHLSLKQQLSIESVESPSRAGLRPSNTEDGGYDLEMWTKAFASQPTEFDYILTTDEIEGVIPRDFRGGTLFRNMPALFERNGVEYGHYLDGDGYVVKFSIDVARNQMRFQSKFVRTEEFKEEEESGEIKSRSTFRTQRKPNNLSVRLTGLDINNAFDLKLKNLANTNVMYWAGKLMVFFEAGVPYRINPISLNTLGKEDLGLPSVLNSGLPVMVPKLKKALPLSTRPFLDSSAQLIRKCVRVIWFYGLGVLEVKWRACHP